jgi:type VI secretion system secreted protein VgrG
MGKFTQANRPLSVKTPLGADDLLLIGFEGNDTISHLFSYRLDMVAENATDIPFDKILGQPCTVTFRWGKENKSQRYFNGICSWISQGERDPVFTHYQMELVPMAWLLTRKAQSRIFQHLSIPDILKKVLTGIHVTYNIQGSFQPRDYCVQYRETDFNFASRLMEEEGIYYFFKHKDGDHEMVVGNTPPTHPAVPEQPSVPYESKFGGSRDELRIFTWEKSQQLRSGKYTLWDHCFELPHKHLEVEKVIQDSVSVGAVSHKLKVANNDKLEIYEFPGEYAQRFDGIDKGGGEQSGDLQKIFEDNKRTVEIRMQQEAVQSLEIEGKGNCRQFVSGHKFTFERHFNADGDYLLTSVSHLFKATSSDYFAGQGQTSYMTAFRAIPMALPFRPVRSTPKPLIQGTQSAVVVGPPGEEIFTDKYGRVKVQFHWDREGKNNADSSCWIRVSSAWAGKQWGMINIPRIGQEVLVDFLEGDPDQPIVVGSLYNAEMMPPYGLPSNKTQSGMQSRSTLQGGPPHYNEFKFEDKKGHEVVHLHAERNLDTSVEADETHSVGVDRRKTINRNETTDVGGRRTETVGKDEAITIGESRTESVGKNETITIGEDRTESVGKNETITISKDRDESVGGNESIQISGLRSVSIGKDDTLKVAKTLRVEVGDKLVLTCGSSGIALTKDGTVEITGKDVSIKGSGKIKVQASSDLTLKGSKIAEN